MSAYTGNCHCSTFKFAVKLSSLTSVFSCNCSLCSRNAYLWVCGPEEFIVLQGESMLKSYRHGTTNHKFCPVCGTSIMSCDATDSEKLISINVRALNGVDTHLLQQTATVVPCSGVSTSDSHSLPLTATSEPEASNPPQGEVLYRANCHCGGISYTIRAAPLERTKSCNCSICARNGVIWAYPPNKSFAILSQSTLTEYTFGRKIIIHAFCGTCAVPMWEQFLNPAKADTIGLNVRAINDLNWAELPSRVHNGKATMPQYEI